MTDFVAKQRYQAVRKQLDQLHYCMPFSKYISGLSYSSDYVHTDVVSSELVERLLNDLLKTTEGYQTLKNTIEMSKHDNSLN